MKIPEIIYLLLSLAGLLLEANRHGKPKTGNHDLRSSLFATFLMLALLYWAGLFH